MFKDGLRHLISSASISSVSVLKCHFFNNVKFSSAGETSLLFASLRKALNRIPPSSCGRVVKVQAVYPLWWRNLPKQLKTCHEQIRA